MSVKIKKRGRPAKNSHTLNQKSIIEQAKLLMRNDGKVPSIRQLATVLNIDAMSIYHYFKNKNELLEAMTVSLMNEVYEPQENQQWQAELLRLAKSYLCLLQQYPGLLDTLLSMTTKNPAHLFIERFDMVIKPLNLESETRSNALNLLADYLHGFALAIKCNDQREPLNIDMVEGPIALLCRAMALR